MIVTNSDEGWCIWLTGLPGAGKSTIAKELKRKLEANGVGVQVLRLDTFRKIIVPEPRYTETERDIVYNTLVFIAKLLIQNGVNVILDATANRRRWRDAARDEIGTFYEVYIECPLEECMEREAGRTDNLVISGLYKKALDRRRSGESQTKGLGQMVGVDVPYEEPVNPDLVIDSSLTTPSESAKIIVEKIILK
jgi:adenylylsulfate kinase